MAMTQTIPEEDEIMMKSRFETNNYNNNSKMLKHSNT